MWRPMRGFVLARPEMATLALACAVLMADGQMFSQPKTDAYMPSLSSFEQALGRPQYAPAIFGSSRFYPLERQL